MYRSAIVAMVAAVAAAATTAEFDAAWDAAIDASKSSFSAMATFTDAEWEAAKDELDYEDDGVIDAAEVEAFYTTVGIPSDVLAVLGADIYQ